MLMPFLLMGLMVERLTRWVHKKRRSNLGTPDGSGVTGVGRIGAAGFEPTTPTTPKWCATKLRYAPSDASYHSKFRRLERLSRRRVS